MRRATGRHPTQHPRAARGRRALTAALAACATLAAGALLAAPAPAVLRGVEGCAEPQYLRDELGTIGQPFAFTEEVSCLPDGETWSNPVIHWADGTTSPGTITSVRSPSPGAGFASVTVTGQHTYNQPGNFPITVVVTDQAGQEYEGGWHTNAAISPATSPSSPCPEGCSNTEPYKGTTEHWNASEQEEGDRAAADAAAERRRVKEEEERRIAEQNAADQATEATELKHRQEREATEAAAREEAEHPACTVPALQGDTLAAARLALTRGHCRLGRVTQSRRHRGPLVVSAQAPRPGERLAHGAPIALTLDTKQASRRRGAR